MGSVFKYWNFILTDEDGTSVIVKDGGTSDNHGVYRITASGANTYYFYVDSSGALSTWFENFAVLKKGGGTLKIELHYKIDGSWIDGGLADSYETDNNLDLDETQAAKWNTVNVQRAIYGVPIRIACTVSVAGDILAQALRS